MYRHLGVLLGRAHLRISVRRGTFLSEPLAGFVLGLSFESGRAEEVVGTTPPLRQDLLRPGVEKCPDTGCTFGGLGMEEVAALELGEDLAVVVIGPGLPGDHVHAGLAATVVGFELA